MLARRLLGLGLLAAAFGGAGAGALVANAAETHNVVAQDSTLTFSPKTITVSVGDTVHWTKSGGQHTSTSVAGQAENWDSGNDISPLGFDHTFNTPGTYQYFCKFHGTPGGTSGMVGRVIVQQTGGQPGQTQPEAPPKVSFNSRTLRSSKRGVVKLRVRNPNAFPISGRVRLDTARKVTVARKRKLKLGSAKFAIAVGARKTVKLKLSKTAGRTLKRHHKLKVNATFVAGTAGQAARKTVKKGITLKAPKGS